MASKIKPKVTPALIITGGLYFMAATAPVQSIVNLIKEFNEDIQYYIFCSDTDLNETKLDVETGKWITYNSITRVWYADKEKRSDTLVSLTEKIQPDVIYIVGIFSWRFNIVPLLFCKAPRKIISTRGMLHPGALSQKKIQEKNISCRLEIF